MLWGCRTEFARMRWLGSDQDRHTAVIMAANQIDIGITDEPDMGSGLQVAGIESELNMFAGRLVPGRIAGAGQGRYLSFPNSLNALSVASGLFRSRSCG